MVLTLREAVSLGRTDVVPDSVSKCIENLYLMTKKTRWRPFTTAALRGKKKRGGGVAEWEGLC